MDGFHFEYMIDGKPTINLHFSLPLSEMSANEQLLIMTQYITDLFLVMKIVTAPSPTPRTDVKSMLNELAELRNKADVEALLRDLMSQGGYEE